VRSRPVVLASVFCHVAAIICVLRVPANTAVARDGQKGDEATPAVVMSSPQPESTPPGGQYRYQGTVILQVDVDDRGNVSHAEVRKPLGYGLDEKAVAAVQTWKFRPATLNGRPIPSRVVVEVTFRLDHSAYSNAKCAVPFAFATMDSNDPEQLA
jgi:TonB family protein